MSDNSSPPRATGRGTTERRAALERLQDASKNKSRLEKGKRPTFLGAEDDEEGDTFDFEAFSRPKEKNRTRKERDSTEGPAARDSLGNGFDDLFNLDDPNASRTGDDNAQGGDLDDLDADAAPVKKKRVVAKMDETRLLGPTGFPKLIEDIKRVKLKGKGHEAQDLKRVLSLYQLWSHQMYPKTNLRDTLTTVEKLCHKRSLQRSLKTYKDDWKNSTKTSTSTSLHPEFDLDPTSLAFQQRDDASEEEEEENGIFSGLNKKGSGSQAKKKTTQQGREQEEDTFDQAELDDLFGDDDDALMASLEAEALGSTSTNQKETIKTNKEAAGAVASTREATEDYDQIEEEQEEEEDDEAAMAAMREMEELLS
ncbi:hypothetical protein JCM16303_006017 [Sporobolomyces ruberrimus]